MLTDADMGEGGEGQGYTDVSKKIKNLSKNSQKLSEKRKLIIKLYCKSIID